LPPIGGNNVMVPDQHREDDQKTPNCVLAQSTDLKSSSESRKRLLCGRGDSAERHLRSGEPRRASRIDIHVGRQVGS